MSYSTSLSLFVTDLQNKVYTQSVKLALKGLD